MRAIQRLWTAEGSKHRTSFHSPVKTAAYAAIDIAAGRNDVVARRWGAPATQSNA
jgi:hypothetical protein